MDGRLPAHIEVTGLIRAVEAQGGFATVLAKGDREAGTILVVCCEKGAHARLYERMPQADGSRVWVGIKSQNIDNMHEFTDYLDRRKQQDGDLWIVELDIADAPRFIGIDEADR